MNDQLEKIPLYGNVSYLFHKESQCNQVDIDTWNY